MEGLQPRDTETSAQPGFGQRFVFTLFTNDPGLASAADGAGVNRIGVDLERLDKDKRQDPSKCWVTDHRIDEIPALRESLSQAQLFARSNPMHEESGAEIERLIAMGVQVIMLPYFRTVEEARRFVGLIDGRAEASLLVETAASAIRIEELVRLDGVDEIHVGLNDLRIDLGMRNHFEVLCSPFLDMLAGVVRDAGIPFGFGGLGRVSDNSLPIPPQLIYPQYPRLGADRALVARVFHAPDYRCIDFTAEMDLARGTLDAWYQRSLMDQTRQNDVLKEEIRAWQAGGVRTPNRRTA